jgi:pyruvate dehydrogenase E1 component beta subunit
VVIAHEAVKQGGFGAEIAAVIAEYGMDLLDAPITRLGAPFFPVPFSPPLEAEYKVSPEKIVAAVKSMF